MGGCCTKSREDQAASPAAASPAPVILTKEQQAPQLETFDTSAMPPTEFDELEATTAAPTGQQLDKATPDLQAPFEAPDMPLTEEQVAERCSGSAATCG